MTEAALTHDGFLGGRVHLWQPKTGFRANTDAVLLAAAVPAQPGQSVLDLGCGVGAVGLCLAARTGCAVTGLELDPATADLARRNAAESGLSMQVVTGDVGHMPPDLRAQRFDHVVFNPPYFAAGAGTMSQDPARDAALRENLPIAAWLDAATRRALPKGTITAILRADRVPDLLRGLDDRLGRVRLLPLAARAGRPAKRVIFQAIKGGRAPFALLAPMVLHEGDAHLRDGLDDSALARAVLRDGGALPVDWAG